MTPRASPTPRSLRPVASTPNAAARCSASIAFSGMPARSRGTYAHLVRSGSSKGNEAAARCAVFSIERNVRAVGGDADMSTPAARSTFAGAWAPHPGDAAETTTGNRHADLNRMRVKGLAMELDARE